MTAHTSTRVDGAPAAAENVTYVTIADDSYYLGAVAFLNSLRLTGNDEPVILLDGGLTERQRATLGIVADVRDAPVSASGVFVVFLKPATYLLGLTGTAVLIDSDVIVTHRMTSVIEEARAGRICAVGVRGEELAHRRFPDEWAAALGLREPVRPQRNVGGGLVVLDVERWDAFLRRWYELCERVPQERADLPFDLPAESVLTNPFAFNEQDVLNALLSSEVPPEVLLDIGVDASPGPPHNDLIRVVDRTRLRCLLGDEEPLLLHYWNHPKPWLPNARPHLAFDAYVDLMARLLTADDVPIRLDRDELPIWLRDDLVGKVVRRGPRLARRSVRRAVAVLPDTIEQRARNIGGAVASKLKLG
jgi:hypothetical protein